MTRGNKESANDRRVKHRFAFEREMRYKVMEDYQVVAEGTGRTVDISSGGVAFEAAGIKTGTTVELSISWPVLLGEACLMRLMVVGRVVRAGKSEAACTIDRYEFRTQGKVCRSPASPGWPGVLDKNTKGELAPRP